MVLLLANDNWVLPIADDKSTAQKYFVRMLVVKDELYTSTSSAFFHQLNYEIY